MARRPEFSILGAWFLLESVRPRQEIWAYEFREAPVDPAARLGAAFPLRRAKSTGIQMDAGSGLEWRFRLLAEAPLAPVLISECHVSSLVTLPALVSSRLGRSEGYLVAVLI